MFAELSQIKLGRTVLLGAALTFAALPPARACDSCAASAALTVTTGLELAQITATTLAVVSAIGLAGGGNGGASMGTASAMFEAAKGAAGHIGSTTMRAVNRDINMRTVLDPQSMNCRVATNNDVAEPVRQIARAQNRTIERGMVDNILFNPSLTPQRIAAGFLYKLCQSGQLAANDFGPNWFALNNCINDPGSVHQFVKISTILDSPVLIPPPQAKMDILNNPAANTPATLLATWNSLNDKEKKYFAATLYCENLSISRAAPQNIRNDAAMTVSNMSAIARNLSAAGTLMTASAACWAELGRRTAINPANPDVSANPLYKQRLEDSDEKIVELLINKRGADPRDYFAYPTETDRQNDTNRLPGYWLSEKVLEQHKAAHGLSIKCANYANSGSNAERTGSMLGCTMMAAMAEKKEAENRKAFIEAVAAIDQAPGAGASLPTAIKTRGGGMENGGALLQDAALEIPGFDQQPMRLDEMLNTMNAYDAPKRTADNAVQPVSMQ